MHRHDSLRPQRDLTASARNALTASLTALLIGVLSACSDPGSSESDGGVADTAADGTTLPDAATGTSDVGGFDVVDPRACPGGWGCACSADADCDTGLCLDLPGPDGKIAKACGTECEEGICPEGQRCRELAGADGLYNVCVDGRARLCDPCKASKDCRVFGLHDSACVRYGAAGNFCAVSCLGDADCGEGYRCTAAQSVEGGSGNRCVRVADAGAPAESFGTCTCSAAAIAAKSSTTCYAETSANGKLLGRCNGTRACGAAGLSACSAKVPQVEACNTIDDDCDGLVDEATCDDGNPCTLDTCAGDNGCKNEPTTAPCDADGTVCTVGDACAAGKCVKGTALDCNDDNECTVDSCHAQLGCRNLFAEGKACDDGNACSEGEACKAGACTGAKAKNCDDGKPCTIDACAAGTCENKLTTGLLCDDGDACTQTDLCSADGSCAGTARVCNDGDPCTIDSCDKATGCKTSQSPDGAGCDDGNLCTGLGTCSAGTCLAGPAKVCTAPGPCFLAHCFAGTGACVVSQRPDGAACEDGDACTLQTLCDSSGSCLGKDLGCDDGDACTADSCDKVKGCQHLDQPCGCDKVADCEDNNACTDDSCETGSKKCINAPSSKSCDDGDACTEGDACGDTGSGAACVPGKSKDCDDNEPCTDDSCDKVKGCQNVAKTDGTACTDGDTCTENDACVAGKCTGKDTCSCGKDADCDDGNACTENACDTGTSTCKPAVPMAKGATCTDGDACTAPDGCDGAGACAAGAMVDCDDGKPCTVDSCDKATGCKHTAATDGTSCNDGDACTENDACSGGTCSGTPADAEVSTWAGSTQGFTDAKGELAQFKLPTGLARVGTTVYVADWLDHRVRAVDKDQNVTTLAGQGIAGETDAVADSARFYNPAALVADAAGENLYVLDSGSHKVRVVKIAGASVTTLAGSNTPGGLGQPPTGGYKDGQGTGAMFDNPMGIARTSSGYVIADAGNHRLRTLVADGTVTTLAGDGTAGATDGAAASATFNGPTGIAVAKDGTIYVADKAGNRIRRLQSGTVTTLAGAAQAGYLDDIGTAARFSAPWGLWIDGAGELLVADSANHRIRVVQADGNVYTYAGSAQGNANGTLDKATFDGPTGVVDDGLGELFIASQTGFRVRRLNDPQKACKLAP
ncbi:MAG: hypothetical protein H6747_14065 [Deltaproteobacteria bacterium]|nr:hypothetical protein [Deltaproteobacteria bacterium]